MVGCVETISERHLLPVREAMMHTFPFHILGFHSDNASEFLNYCVAALRENCGSPNSPSPAPAASTDNALVESKNRAIVRKYIGYGNVPAEHAEAFQRFYTAHLNPYLNFHRPCGFATVAVNERGKRSRRYPADQYRTPREKLADASALGKAPEQTYGRAARASGIHHHRHRGRHAGCWKRATSFWRGAEPCEADSGTIQHWYQA